MVMCEKCWNDAYFRMIHRGGCQTEHYYNLLKERKDNPCSLDEQMNVSQGENMTDKYSSEDLREFDKISDNLIIELFQTADKRYAIKKAIKIAFDLGRFRG